MKILFGSLSAIFYTIIAFHCTVHSMALEQMHQRLETARTKSDSISFKTLAKRGGLTAQESPLKLDIQEENGVRLVKGLTREKSPLDKLFWSKQIELITLLTNHEKQGLDELKRLMTKRCVIKNVNPLLTFIHELASEDIALDECEGTASGKELEEAKKYRATLDALLAYLFTALTEGDACCF